MDLKKLEKDLREAVQEYIDGEESYGDNMVVSVTPVDGKVLLVDEDEADESTDLYDVMDFIDMDPANPGVWKVDDEAIASVVADYSS